MRAWHIRFADEATPAIRSSSSAIQVHGLALPDKPSIVVLPFDNMSAEAGQDYLADGIVEAITAALSCIRSFFVIARSSAFTYKGRTTLQPWPTGSLDAISRQAAGGWRRAAGSPKRRRSNSSLPSLSATTWHGR